ncbi:MULTISPECIES: hypothetical protein [Butyricimonas]|uniref:hypothetical protein n=1 Tax=Butyricimonas TaxID=574697 RepID=UPI0007FB343D|nr:MULTISPECIES: hypothetical protein [Butyricimonas]
MYNIGDILLVENYPLPSEYKDKFFIVIGNMETGYQLLSMTTSQLYFDISLVKHGEIVDRELSGFCFPAGHVIGINNFCFNKHTFLSHRGSIREHDDNFLSKFNVVRVDHIKDDELEDLVYSFYKSEKVKRKYKPSLENVLENIIK